MLEHTLFQIGFRLPTFVRKNRKYNGTIPSLLVLFNAIHIFLVGTCGAKCGANASGGSYDQNRDWEVGRGQYEGDDGQNIKV